MLANPAKAGISVNRVRKLCLNLGQIFPAPKNASDGTDDIIRTPAGLYKVGRL